jgi:hypothetical protein
MWFGGFLGVSRFDGRTWRADVVSGDGQFIGQVQSLHVDRSGNAWIGTNNAGVFRYDGVAFRHYFSTSTTCPSRPSPNIPSLNVLGSNCVTAMHRDRTGELWFGGFDGGGARLDRTGRWSAVRRTALAPVSDSITALAEDRDGTLWFGSLEAGLASLDSVRLAWTLHRRADGVASDSVRTLYVDGAGDLWIGTRDGFSRRSGPSWTSWLQGGVDGVPVEVHEFLEGAGGQLWIRTSLALYSLDPTRALLRRWNAGDSLADDVVTTMIRTVDDAVWFGTARGLSRLHDGEWTTWKTFGIPGDSAVRALHEDRAGVVWVGTDFDAARWNGSSWITITAQELGSVPVTGIFSDAGGTVWLATFRGLSRWNGDAWRVYDSRGNGLAADQITGFLEDSQQRLWFASNGGLTEHEPDRVAPQTRFVSQPPPLSPSRIAGFTFGAAYGEAADLELSTSWDGAPFGSWTTDNTWSLGGIPDGQHTFTVRARDWLRNVDPTPARYTFEVDATPPPAEIAEPRFGAPIQGRIAVFGTAEDPRFRDFEVRARPVGTPTWNDPAVRVLASSTTPVQSDTLALFDTAPLPDGNWEIRLAVHDTLGLEGPAQVRVIVDNVAPFASVTSPARIVAVEGGDVFTTDAEVHLYFPPNAFDADAIVTIEPVVGGAPDTLPGGAIRRSEAWDIGWTRARLVKAGLLEMRPSTTGGILAVYAQPPGGMWQRLGGSAQDEGAGLGLALTGPGRYAVFEEIAPPSQRGGIASVSLTPRAFSPYGTFATHDVAIGFVLARPGPATVKIYNRAGRLARTVVEGFSANAGSNLVRWNGQDRDGRVVEAGLYYVTVEALGEVKTHAVAVVR